MAAGTTNAAALPVRFRHRAGRVVWVVPTLSAVGLWAVVPPATPALGRPLPLTLVFLAFLLIEPAQLHFEFRRQTYSLSLADGAVCAGLFLLPPVGLVLVRLLANALILPYLVVRRRRPPSKQLFNLCNHILDTVVAVTIFALLHGGPVVESRSWWAATLAIAATSLSGLLMVAMAIVVTQGAISRSQVLDLVGPSVGVSMVSTALVLVGLIVVDVDAYGAILLALLAGLSALGYRAYGRFLRQHGNLGRVYEFSRMVERSRVDAEGLRDGLDWLRETFNATSVRLLLEASMPTQRVSMMLDDDGLTTGPWLPDPLHERLRGGPYAVLTSRRSAVDDEREQAALTSRGVDELMAVCLRTSSSVLGFLELYDRRGQVTFFSDEDLRLLENLATHLTAALENQQLVERLRHAAYHDRLTGLPNRERLIAAVDEAIADVAGTDDLVAVLLLDIDSFKDVNDSLGHDHGDELLVMVGDRLRLQTTDDALAARMGADEFAMICRVPDVRAAERRATSLRDALAAPYPLAGLAVHVGVSVGVAAAPVHSQDGGTLLQRADVALYTAKSKGKAVATYLPTLDQASVHRLQLVTQLREALDSGQVTVQYQPKVGMASRDLVGVEALVRWEHPQYGQVVPDDFVPLAERTGLIGPLTMHVLRASLLQCRSWLDRDLRIGVAVNLSVRNLLDEEFPQRVAELLAETGTPGDLLAFEITESSVMNDPERSLPVLHRLHELGIGLSIDDFGTGYSSLAYLRRLPVDEVKIDKVFVLGMGTDLGDLAIVRAIIELGHSLGLRVVAEGVEDELARDLLAGMDCDVAQGYLFSRALPGDRLDAWFAARTVVHPGQPGVRGRRLQVAG
jgi:diguanylate cyclase (GGDEF)-like protein